MRKPLESLPSWGAVMAHTGSEATHMAYSACEAVVMAHIKSEATHMAYPACEAGVMAHMGSEPGSEAAHMAYLACDAVVMALMATFMEQNGAKRRTMQSLGTQGHKSGELSRHPTWVQA